MSEQLKLFEEAEVIKLFPIPDNVIYLAGIALKDPDNPELGWTYNEPTSGPGWPD